MNDFMKRNKNAAGWNLRKTGTGENMVSYELRTDGAHDGCEADVALRVINGLFGGMQVGVIAESNEAAGIPALSSLGSLWRNGRLLKRGKGGAFVTMENDFDVVRRGGVESCVGTGAAFRFLGFEDHAPTDRIFRGLLDAENDAVIELSCPDLAEGVMCIRWDTEKVDENRAIRDISQAVGGALSLEM